MRPIRYHGKLNRRGRNQSKMANRIMHQALRMPPMSICIGEVKGEAASMFLSAVEATHTPEAVQRDEEFLRDYRSSHDVNGIIQNFAKDYLQTAKAIGIDTGKSFRESTIEPKP